MKHVYRAHLRRLSPSADSSLLPSPSAYGNLWLLHPQVAFSLLTSFMGGGNNDNDGFSGGGERVCVAKLQVSASRPLVACWTCFYICH